MTSGCFCRFEVGIYLNVHTASFLIWLWHHGLLSKAPWYQGIKAQVFLRSGTPFVVHCVHIVRKHNQRKTQRFVSESTFLLNNKKNPFSFILRKQDCILSAVVQNISKVGCCVILMNQIVCTVYPVHTVHCTRSSPVVIMLEEPPLHELVQLFNALLCESKYYLSIPQTWNKYQSNMLLAFDLLLTHIFWHRTQSQKSPNTLKVLFKPWNSRCGILYSNHN